MSRQLTFNLPLSPALKRASFYVSPANETAASAIGHWRDWPSGKLALIGPEGAGKSHLANVWAEESGAVQVPPDWTGAVPPGAKLIVEDVDQLGGDAKLEESLFHLHNRVLAARGRLLLTGREPPSSWPITLPDLASRMAGSFTVRIAPPDDALLVAVLTKHFADRQLVAPSWLIPWLLPRMPRSFAGAAQLVALLDASALERRAPIDRASARRALETVTLATA